MAVSAKDKMGLLLLTATTVTVAVHAKPWQSAAAPDGLAVLANTVVERTGVSTVVFRDFNVLPMDRETVLYRHVVVVEDGEIVEVGRLGGVRVPPDAQVVEGHGRRFLMPGLTDAHVHIEDRAHEWLPQLLAHGITTVFSVTDALPSRDDGRGLPSPNVYRTGHVTFAGKEEEGSESSGLAGLCTHGLTPAMLGIHLPEDLRSVAVDWSRSGIWLTSRLVAFDAVARQWGSPEEFAAELRRRPSRDLTSEMRRAWTVDNPYTALDPALRSRAAELSDFKHRLIRELKTAASPVLAGTDTPMPLVAPGASLLDELRALEDAGFSRYEALAAATTAPARFIRTFIDPSASFGVIRPGGRADLVMLEGDPLEELAVLSRPLGLLVRGEWIPGESLEAWSAAPRRNALDRNPVGG